MFSLLYYSGILAYPIPLVKRYFEYFYGTNWILSRRHAKCKMLNAECKMNVFSTKTISIVRFAHTIILHFAF